MKIFNEEFLSKVLYFSDIENDKDFLNRVMSETVRISSDTSLSSGRSTEKIRQNVLQGLALEYLIAKNHNSLFVSADKIHDLCHNLTGEFVEVKAYSTVDSDDKWILKNTEYLRNSKINKSKYMIVYTYDYFEKSYKYLTLINI